MFGTEGNDRRSRSKTAVLAITVTVVAVLLILTFVVPDRTGQVRTDVEVGDYYVLDSNRYTVAYTVEEITEDGLVVEMNILDKVAGSSWLEKSQMSKEEFLERILFSGSISKNSVLTGVIYHETFTGHKFCHIYNSMMNEYHVGEYGVIFYSGIGGNFWTLTSTSLLYGIEHPEEAPMPSIRNEEAVSVD